MSNFAGVCAGGIGKNHCVWVSSLILPPPVSSPHLHTLLCCTTLRCALATCSHTRPFAGLCSTHSVTCAVAGMYWISPSSGFPFSRVTPLGQLPRHHLFLCFDVSDCRPRKYHVPCLQVACSPPSPRVTPVGSNFTAVKSLRVLRPLRSVNVIPALRQIVNSLLASTAVCTMPLAGSRLPLPYPECCSVPAFGPLTTWSPTPCLCLLCSAFCHPPA